MKIGDIVKFLNQEGTGKIVRMETQYIWVEDSFGFVHRYPSTEILPISNDWGEIEVEMPTIPKKISTPKPIVKEEIIVDLHFGQLVDYPDSYEAHEKLLYQLNVAREAIETNRNRTKKLILIHGKGNGVLEKEIYKILEKQTKIRYKDADFRRYKLGAVEINYL